VIVSDDRVAAPTLAALRAPRTFDSRSDARSNSGRRPCVYFADGLPVVSYTCNGSYSWLHI
jgi:hypothetical protein